VHVDQDFLSALINASPDGVVVCDVRNKDLPIVYINDAFADSISAIGHNIVGRFLNQLEDSDLPNKNMLVQAITKIIGTSGAVQPALDSNNQFVVSGVLNQYTQLHAVPIYGKGHEITYVACFYRVMSQLDQAQAMEFMAAPVLNKEPTALVRQDRQTGLLSRACFDDYLRRDFYCAQREQRPLSVFLFSIDSVATYKEVFGASGSELTFKRVVSVVAGCFRRAGDACTRLDDSRVLVATLTTQPEQAYKFAHSVRAKVRDLAIHHPRAAGSRYLTLGVTVVSRVPERTDTIVSFIASLFEDSTSQTELLQEIK
jgi:GGDEF domain-containing protein